MNILKKDLGIKVGSLYYICNELSLVIENTKLAYAYGGECRLVRYITNESIKKIYLPIYNEEVRLQNKVIIKNV